MDFSESLRTLSSLHDVDHVIFGITIRPRVMTLCKSGYILWPKFLQFSNKFHQTLRILLSQFDDHILLGSLFNLFCLFPHGNLASSCGHNSFEFQTIFIKLSGYCCQHFMLIVFYWGHDWIFSAKPCGHNSFSFSTDFHQTFVGLRSTVGSASDSRARGPGFDTRSGHILSFSFR